MLTKKQMYMLIGFIVIIIASLVMMPETDGFKTFWGLFGLSNRKKNKKSQNVACTSRGLAAKPDGTCQSCFSADKTKPIFSKSANECVTCSVSTNSAKTYYSPSQGCVKFCPGANLNQAGDAVVASSSVTGATATWQDYGLRSASANDANVCRT